MMPKHAFNISLSKFTLVYKRLLFTVITGLILAAISVGVLYPLLAPIITRINDAHIIKALGSALQSLFGGNIEIQSASFQALSESYLKIIDIFSSDSAVIWSALAIVFVMILIFKFFDNISIYTTSDITNNFMNSASNYGFTSNMIINIKNSSKYSLLMTLFDLVSYAVNFGIIWLVGFVLYKISVFFMIPMALLAIIVLFSIKNLIFAYWLPCMIVDKKSVITALKDSIKLSFTKKHLLTNLGAYCAFWLLAISFSLVFGVVTFGLALLIIAAYSVIFSRAYNLVSYYNIDNLKYYIDKNTVINNDNKIGTQL